MLGNLLAAAGLCASITAAAHNNPTFRETLVATVKVENAEAGAPSASEAFSLTLPDNSVQLLFKVVSKERDAVVFTLARDGQPVAESVRHGGAANIAHGNGFTLQNVSGASGPIAVEIYAKVLDRSAAKVSSGDLEAGKKVYRKANCVGCHKWHGGGGGGYGGAARSLRETKLDRSGLIDVVRCGRPATRMPFHARGAYEDVPCYGGLSAAQLGNRIPPKASALLRERQIESVVDYVIVKLKGRGEPTLADCTEFWGKRSSQCKSMK